MKASIKQEKSTRMRIHVKLSQIEEKITFDVDAMDTVLSVKAKIQTAEAITIDKLDLIYSGKELKDHQSLASYNICNGSSLCAFFPPIDVMLITVEFRYKYTNTYIRKIKLKVKSWYTVENVKDMIQSLEKTFSSTELLLYFGERKLANSKTMAELGISHGHTLSMTI